MESSVEEEKQMLPLYNILPSTIRRKIKALKKLQLQSTILESKYFLEVHKLECKFSNLQSELFAKRKDIVQGIMEPSEADCDFNDGQESPDESDPTLIDLRKRVQETRNLNQEVTGIPEFWLTVLKNAGKTFDLVQPHDEPILKYLIDIKVTLTPDPMGFTIGFKFAPNRFISTRILTKEYQMRCAVDGSSPWSFDGPEIVKSKGCKIEWKEGMNVTRKAKLQKKEKKKTEEYVKQESFFNFFSPPDVPDYPDGKCGELHCKLAEDYALGIYLREKLVPYAVLYFTGDAIESDSSCDESESESSQTCQSDGYDSDNIQDVEVGDKEARDVVEAGDVEKTDPDNDDQNE